MLFSKLSLLLFAGLATETLARSPGRFARRFYQDEVAQPTPAVTPAPILPADKLKARAESSSSNTVNEADSSVDAKSAVNTEDHVHGGEHSASSVSHTASDATIAATSGLGDEKLNNPGGFIIDPEDGLIGMDNETTIKYTYTSPLTTSSITRYAYDDDDDTATESTTTTVKNSSASIGSMPTQTSTMDNEDYSDDETPTLTMTSAHATRTSSGYMVTQSSMMDDEDYMDVETVTVSVTTAWPARTHDSYNSQYTPTSTYPDEVYPSVSTGGRVYRPTWTTPTGMDSAYQSETSTGSHGYEELMYTTKSNGSPTMDIAGLSPTDAIDLKKFRGVFGDSNAASIDCISLGEGVKQGVAVKDLINILKQPDGNVYKIDRSGCFQAKCIGDYGVLRLCNLKPTTGVMTFTAAEVKVFLSFLLQAVRPNWESELSLNFDKLVYRPDAITFCGSSNDNLQYQIPKLRNPLPQGIDLSNSRARAKRVKPALNYSPHVENINMPLSFQPRFPNYWGDNLGVPVDRDARFNGIISNAANGWAIVIDSSSRDDLKCNSNDNFRTTCGTADAKHPENCKWDNTVPKPYFVSGGEMLGE
ncbi:hypothetical protein TWF506_001960 [Arthrobotrys conoides]|uniref:Uncharacterized protein n=1 Tax=Arthrobotrys conoides TaxID=74498 RepID=A0AAN8PSE3_9PEZI